MRVLFFFFISKFLFIFLLTSLATMLIIKINAIARIETMMIVIQYSSLSKPSHNTLPTGVVLTPIEFSDFDLDNIKVL